MAASVLKALGLYDKFREWISRNNQHLSILVTGKTGVGKSRLVNALVGERVAEEGQQKTALTVTVTSYRINGIEILVWDSPGLQDDTGNEELYLEDIKKKLHKGLDVIIYCIKMEDRRFHKEDKDAFRTLTQEFGKKLWKNAVIALTFANKVEDPDEGDEVAYFLQDLTFWQEEIDKLIAELALDLDSIPLVPVGNSRKPRLPNCENWLSELWISCYQRMSHSTRMNLYIMSKHRIKCPGSANIKVVVACCSSVMQTDTSQSGVEPIPLNKKQQDSFWKSTWEAFKDHCVTVCGMPWKSLALGWETIFKLFGYEPVGKNASKDKNC